MKNKKLKETFDTSFITSPQSITQIIYNYLIAMILFFLYIGHYIGLVYSLKCRHYLWFFLNFILGLFCIPLGCIYFFFYYDPTTCLIPAY